MCSLLLRFFDGPGRENIFFGWLEAGFHEPLLHQVDPIDHWLVWFLLLSPKSISGLLAGSFSGTRVPLARRSKFWSFWPHLSKGRDRFEQNSDWVCFES